MGAVKGWTGGQMGTYLPSARPLCLIPDESPMVNPAVVFCEVVCRARVLCAVIIPRLPPPVRQSQDRAVAEATAAQAASAALSALCCHAGAAVVRPCRVL